ncbi:HAD family phosphatase [Ectopseudomonas mendocina]|uniref:HAD family phosphatase n=1 Tax=Ectopseudomonas mendocina TaxID=300 RepID=A0ABZ2RKR8_ECTME
MNKPAINTVLFSLTGCLVDFGARSSFLQQTTPSNIADDRNSDCAQLTPGAREALKYLKQHSITCAWVEPLPVTTCSKLSAQLPETISGTAIAGERPLPAPDAIWQALIALRIKRIQGCMLISGDPLVLQAALNAGLWTVGLAVSGPLCGQPLEEWKTLPQSHRDAMRTEATLALYRMGVHSVIDQLTELPGCLEDIAQRRLKGEKP